MKKAYFNWSSGKDSALALYKAMKSGIYDIRSLFTIIKKNDSKIAMHEIGIDLLQRQAEAIGIPLTVLEFEPTASSDEYHSFVFDGPIFSSPVKFKIVKRYYIDYPNETNTQRNRYWYLELG